MVSKVLKSVLITSAAIPAFAFAQVDTCEPYQCVDGTEVARCSEDGHVINYFAEPCLTHGGEIGPRMIFKDVPVGHPYDEAIDYLKSQGIVKGYPDGTFKPWSQINRVEFLKIVMEAGSILFEREYGESPGGPSYPCFIYETKEAFHAQYGEYPDVDFNGWYAPYVCVAIRSGIMTGYPDGTMRPNIHILFTEAAKIVAETFDLPIEETSVWYEGYINALAEKGAIPTDIMLPQSYLKRGEMAEIVYRLMTNTTDKPSKTLEDLAPYVQRKSYSNKYYSLQYPNAWIYKEWDDSVEEVSFGPEYLMSGGLSWAVIVYEKETAPTAESIIKDMSQSQNDVTETRSTVTIDGHSALYVHSKAPSGWEGIVIILETDTKVYVIHSDGSGELSHFEHFYKSIRLKN